MYLSTDIINTETDTRSKKDRVLSIFLIYFEETEFE